MALNESLAVCLDAFVSHNFTYDERKKAQTILQSALQRMRNKTRKEFEGKTEHGKRYGPEVKNIINQHAIQGSTLDTMSAGLLRSTYGLKEQRQKVVFEKESENIDLTGYQVSKDELMIPRHV